MWFVDCSCIIHGLYGCSCNESLVHSYRKYLPTLLRSIIKACVIPVLRFESENWILWSTSLEAFSGEPAKRDLKWPKTLSKHSCSDHPGFGVHHIKAGIEEAELSEEAIAWGSCGCGWYDDEINDETHFTDVILLNADVVNMWEMKRLIRHADWEGCLLKFTKKAPLIANVVNQGGGWIKLWHAAMDLGTPDTEGLTAPGCWYTTTRAQSLVFCVRRTIELNLDKDNFLAVEQLLTHLVNGDIKFVYKSWNSFWTSSKLWLYQVFRTQSLPILYSVSAYFVHCIIMPHERLYRWALSLNLMLTASTVVYSLFPL